MKKINILSKIILIISIFGFFLFIYKDLTAPDDLKGYFLIHSLLFLIVLIILILTILFTPKLLIYFNIFFLSFIGSLYLFEGYLFISGDIKFFSNKRGFWFNDYIYLQKEIKKKNGFISESLNTEELLSFSGLSNSKIIHCNENGYFSSYKSDRYGFNNPDYVWDHKKDIVIIGDSYIHGSCVNPGNDTASQLRKITKLNTISLGWHGTGPLRQYASFLEYIENFPKYIIWFYFENDLEELEYEMDEMENQILLSYYKDHNFRQNLKDHNVRKYIDEQLLIRHEEFMNTDFKLPDIHPFINLKNYLKLYNSRQFLIYNINKYINIIDDDTVLENKEILEVYLSLIENMKSISQVKKSNLIIAYLPRQKYGFSKRARRLDKIKKKLIEFTKKENIGFIDIENLLEKSYINPSKLYPQLHKGMHFNEKGYKFIAENIAKYIDKKK